MSQVESRKAPRRPIEMNARFRMAKSTNEVVEVSDLSETGCRVECALFPLHQGNRVMLRPDGFESFVGTICWVSGITAGIEFDKPLHSGVVDHLVRQNPKAVTQMHIEDAW